MDPQKQSLVSKLAFELRRVHGGGLNRVQNIHADLDQLGNNRE